MIVDYEDTTNVSISAGIFEVDGLIIIKTTATNGVALTSLAAGYDMHYIYADKSASSSSTLTVYDETTEPVKNETKRGWYHPTNTSDRLLGEVKSPAGSAIIAPFDRISYGAVTRTFQEQENFALDMDPDGTWQTPNISELSALIPVNSIEAFIRLQGRRNNSFSVPIWLNNEVISIMSGHTTSPFYQPFYTSTFAGAGSLLWGKLGASRNVKVFDLDDSANALSAWLGGIGTER
jgi:hypothetical protein